MVFEGRFSNAAAGLFNKSLAFILLVLYLMFPAQDTVHALSFHINAPVPFSRQTESKRLVKEPFVTEFVLGLFGTGTFLVGYRRTIVSETHIKLMKLLRIYTRKELVHLLNALSLFLLFLYNICTGSRPCRGLWASFCSLRDVTRGNSFTLVFREI